MYEIYGGNHCYVIFIYAYITATQVRLAYTLSCLIQHMIDLPTFRMHATMYGERAD